MTGEPKSDGEFHMLEEAPDLPPCPRCGAPAAREERRWVNDRPWARCRYPDEDVYRHEARIVCSRTSKCYHTGFHPFPDDIGHREDHPEDNRTDEEVWSEVEQDWRKHAEKRRSREQETLCSCRRTIVGRPGRTWNYCPWCGDKI